MAIHRFSENVLVKNGITAVLSAATVSGTGIDTLGYRRAAVTFVAATGAATTANFNVQDSPDNSAWTTITGATLGTAVPASTTAAYVCDIDMAKRQRYLRVQLIGTGAAGAASAHVDLIEGAYRAPAQDNSALSV